MIYIYGVVAALIMTLAGTTYVLKIKLNTAEIKQEVAEDSLAAVTEANGRLLKAIEADTMLQTKLYNDYKAARDNANDYRQKLAEHDLSDLAKAKPGLITIYARRATERVLREIEAAANGTSEALPIPPSSGSN
jgi:predicted RNA-binding protein Jag